MNGTETITISSRDIRLSMIPKTSLLERENIDMSGAVPGTTCRPPANHWILL